MTPCPVLSRRKAHFFLLPGHQTPVLALSLPAAHQPFPPFLQQRGNIWGSRTREQDVQPWLFPRSWQGLCLPDHLWFLPLQVEPTARNESKGCFGEVCRLLSPEAAEPGAGGLSPASFVLSTLITLSQLSCCRMFSCYLSFSTKYPAL